MFQPGAIGSDQADQQQTDLCACYAPETLTAGANPAALCQRLQSRPPRRWRRLLLRSSNRDARPQLRPDQRCRLEFRDPTETFPSIQALSAAHPPIP